MAFSPCMRLDTWLWEKGLGHPQIMPIIRNEILLAGFFLVFGLPLMLFSPWPFWFGVGNAIMALTFYSLANFFLHTSFGIYSSALLVSVLLRWAGRLLLVVCLLYVALVLCAAPVSAIIAGLVCASILALVTYALSSKRRRTNRG